MNEKVVEAIVIGSTEINEKDKMIRAICSDGYLSFFAKGVVSIKSKNAPSLSTFSKSSFTLFVSKNNNYSLKTGVLKKTFFTMSNYSEMAICSCLEELCKLFISETSTGDTFTLLDNSLDSISNGEDPLLIGTQFVASLLKIEGLLPLEKTTNLKINEQNLLNSICESKEINSYEKSELVDVLVFLIDYIETNFNIKIRSKDLVKII